MRVMKKEKLVVLAMLTNEGAQPLLPQNVTTT